MKIATRWIRWIFPTLVVLFALLLGARAEAATCGTEPLHPSGIIINPSHGKVFYIDTGSSPVLNAGYIGYRVTNNTGSQQSGLWTQLSGFTGTVISLVNKDDAMMSLPSLENGTTGTSYFLMKATGATTSAQGHTLKVYDGRPDLPSSTLLYTCDFSFSKVQETISANSNKLADNGYGTALAVDVSDSSPELGQLITISVEGSTGIIGAGSAPDGSIIWLTPAAVSTWPTRALRLESVSVTFDGNKNFANTADQTTFTNQLLIKNASTTPNVDKSAYRAFYNFRVIGRPQGTVNAVPVAQIASGSQIKHTASPSKTLTFPTFTVTASLTKGVTSSTGLTVCTCGDTCDPAKAPGCTPGAKYVAVPYRLAATS